VDKAFLESHILGATPFLLLASSLLFAPDCDSAFSAQPQMRT
jgi:hypothetical protein